MTASLDKIFDIFINDRPVDYEASSSYGFCNAVTSC